MSPARSSRCVSLRVVRSRLGSAASTLVDGRLEEVEPQPVALEGQSAATGDDDPAGGLVVVAEAQEDALEGAAVGGGPVEEEGDSRPRLAEGPRGDEVDDRGRGDPDHRGLERRVRRRKNDVVEEEDEARGDGRRAEHGAVEGAGTDAARAQGDELRVRVEPAEADEHADEKRHRQRQDHDPRQREQDEPRHLGKRGAAPDREVGQHEDRTDEQDERVGRETQEERRPDLADDRPGDQAGAHRRDSAEQGGVCKAPRGRTET